MKPSLAEVRLVLISSCCPIQLNFPQTSVLVQPQDTSHAVSLVPVTFLTFLCVVPVPLSYKLSFSRMRGMYTSATYTLYHISFSGIIM
jgi:hypothetical protein